MRIVTLFLIIIMLSSGVALSSLGLKLTKTCDAYDADIEETVNYTYFVENTGNENLFSLNLVDDRLGTIPLSQTTLAPGVNLSVTFEHKINKTDMPGPLRNNANATALGPSLEPVASNTASFQLALGFGGHIDVKKSLVSTPTPINIGKMVIYRITVKNPNTVPLHDVRITQDVLYSPYAIINTTLTLDKNYLAPGDTATGYYVYIVKEDDILGPPGSHAPTGQFDISNTVDAEANPPWESVGGNTVTSYFQKNVPGKYSSNSVVKKFASPTEGGINTEITFKIFVNNTGDTLLNRTELWDLLPAGLDYVSSSPVAVPSSNVNGTTTLYWTNLSQTLGILLVGGKYVVEVKAKISGSNLGTLTNKATSKSYNLRNEFNTSINETPIIARKQNISVVKTSDISSGGPGALVNFSLTVKNTGNITLKNVFVGDLLPIGMNYISSWPAGSNNQQYVNWPDIGSMVPDSSKQLWVEAVINGPISENKTLTNRVDVEGKPEYGNNVTVNDTASVEAFGPNISVIKTSDFTFGSAGAVINFTLNVTNIGSGLLPHVFVCDLLPTGMSYVSSSIDSTHSGQTVNWSDIGPLRSGERKQLWIVAHIDGPVSGILNLTNRVDVEGKPEHGNNVTNNTTTTVEVRESKITVTKTADPTFGSPSTNVNFTLVVNNTGSTPLPHVFVSDLLPAGMSYVSSSIGSTQSGQTVSWSDIGPLSSGDSKQLWIVAHIDGPINGIQTLTNRVDVQGKPEHGQNVTNSSTSDVRAQESNIQVTKTADPTFGSPSTNVNFTLVVNNSGSTPLPHVFVSDLLPAGMSYVSSSIGSTHSGQTVSWSDIGPLSSGDSKQLWIVAHIDGPINGIQTLTNRVDVQGKPEHGQNVTNSSTADVRAQESNIQVTKTANPTFGSPSTNVNFTLVVNNSGSTLLPHVFVSDLLPAGMSYVSSSIGSTHNGQIVNWSDIGPLGSGERKQLWIVAHIDGPVSGIRTLTNRVDVQGKPEHGQNVTNSSTADVRAQESNIQVTKTADPTFGSPSTNVNFTLVVNNSGSTPLPHVFVNDLLPAGMSYVSSSSGSTHSGQTVNWSDIGPLRSGERKLLWIVAHIDGPVSGIRTLTNRVGVEGKPEHGQNVTNSSTADVKAEGANIMVQKTADPTFGSAGTFINFTLNVTNNGAALLGNVFVSDKLPGGLTYDSSSAGSVNSGRYVNWTEIGPMPVGDMLSLWIKAKIDGTVYGTLTNLVFVTGKPSRGDPVTNSTWKDVTALKLSISGRKFNDLDGDGTHDGDPDPGLVGWTIELVNLTSGQVVRSIITNESGLYQMDNVIRGKYIVREVQQPGWRQTCPAQGNYSITVDHSDVNEMDFGNQRAGEISRINVTKVAYPIVASPGAKISFVINILNNGKTHLGHVHAVDTLPTGMIYISDNWNGSVSGKNISWNDLDDLDPGASHAIHLVAMIDRNISGRLIDVVYVNATDPAGGEVNDSALAEVRSLLPKIKVSKEPVQYGQYCEAKTISGVGIIESRTSIEDKTIALEYDDTLAGEGEIELESAEVMSEAAEKLQRDVPSLDPENQSSLNLFADTKLAFKGAKPLTGGKSIHSMAFYGGSGARIKDIFSAEEMEKEQTSYFSSTDKASSPQTIGTDLKSSFNGTIETDSKMHNMFSQDINSLQLFSGVFNLDKVIKFHKNVTTDEPNGIDC
jgi:uncharacterized repeat protein (TIGR01451 family)